MSHDQYTITIVILSFLFGALLTSAYFIDKIDKANNAETSFIPQCNQLFGQENWKVTKTNDSKWTCTALNGSLITSAINMSHYQSIYGTNR